jgi:P27 family predicted phage terminase small subunit
MGARGPHPKPTAVLAMNGTLRQDRHGGRAKNPKAKGIPQPPAYLDEVALAHWNEVVPELVAIKAVKRVDQHVLIALCEAWSQYRSLYDARTAALDKAKHSYAVSAARKSWTDLAARCAMTPADRVKVETDEPTQGDVVDSLIA